MNSPNTNESRDQRWYGPLEELFTGSAFKAHPMDSETPLAVRFAGECVLVLMTSRERAATLRVVFAEQGRPVVSGARQIAQRSKGELVSVLRAEARASGARWVVLVLGSGWQAQFAGRSLRGLQGEVNTEPSRYRFFEDPSLLLHKPSGDCLYTAVDHPQLDQAVVFGVKRRELESLAEDVREAGLGLASVRLGVASMLEELFSREGASACRGDLLVSDGLGVLLLSLERGAFASPDDQGLSGSGMPRQYANRPGDILQDIARLRQDNGPRALRCVLPPELGVGEAGPVAAPGQEGMDPVCAVLSNGVLHDLHPGLERRRAPLGVGFRRRFRCGLVAACLLAAATLCVEVLAYRGREEAGALEAEAEAFSRRSAENTRRLAVMRQRREEALEHAAWLGTHPDAQGLVLRLLRNIPATVSLERLSAQLDEGGRQLGLEFVLLGAEQAQLEAVRGMESALLGLGYRIGERSMPGQAGRGSFHRWRILLGSFTEVR